MKPLGTQRVEWDVYEKHYYITAAVQLHL